LDFLDRTAEYTAKNFGLIVIDTFNSLYSAEVAKSSGKAFGLNRELNRQLAILAQIAKTQKTPVIITSQVRSVFDENYVSVAPVATRVLKFWAEIILAMKLTENAQIIKVVIEKTGDITQEIVCFLRIEETGIRDYPFQQ
jgi:RecA/RadA recombinase